MKGQVFESPSISKESLQCMYCHLLWFNFYLYDESSLIMTAKTIVTKLKTMRCAHSNVHRPTPKEVYEANVRGSLQESLVF